VIDADVLSKYA